jgi:hypothetical protein
MRTEGGAIRLQVKLIEGRLAVAVAGVSRIHVHLFSGSASIEAGAGKKDGIMRNTAIMRQT